MRPSGADARLLLDQALSDVLGEATAAHLRGDSPLLASGGTGVLSATDALVLADVVEQRAADAGVRCRLTDEDFVLSGAILTVSELQSRVDARVREGLELAEWERG